MFLPPLIYSIIIRRLWPGGLRGRGSRLRSPLRCIHKRSSLHEKLPRVNVFILKVLTCVAASHSWCHGLRRRRWQSRGAQKQGMPGVKLNLDIFGKFPIFINDVNLLWLWHLTAGMPCFRPALHATSLILGLVSGRCRLNFEYASLFLVRICKWNGERPL